MPPFRKLLVANRSGIAIRVLRAASELGIRTVAIFSHEDRFALHRFKADQSFLVGKGKEPVAAYLDIDDILRIAHDARVDAIHPGYGFLSENPDFVEAVEQAGLTFIGPSAEAIRAMGLKDAAKALLVKAGVPARIGTLTRGGKSYRVVLAGPFNTRNGLNSGLQAARTMGFADAFVR